ncbi:MAG: ATP-binding cassette domain-containing protein [Planctomycetota bacterium]
MALVTLTDVSKTYDAERVLLDRVTFTVRSEDRIGLIGPNGAGKSTLLKLLAGLETPDSGERTLRRGTRLGYLEQEPRFPADMTIRDIVREGLRGREEVVQELATLHQKLGDPNLTEPDMHKLLAREANATERLEALGGHDVEHKVEAMIDGVGLADPEALAGTLSGGESRRVALARLLLEGPEILLLDEPTNHLDAFVVAWLEDRLAALGTPLVLVTHDRYLLDRVANRIVEVDRGQLHGYEGGYLDYVAKRAARLESEEKSERSRQLLLRRESAWVKRSPLARTSKSKSRIQRFEAMLADMPTALPGELELAFPTGPRLGARVIKFVGVSHDYGGAPVLPQIDFELLNGMRLGIVGPNGAGKSTFVKILLGELEPKAGVVERGETVAFGVMQQGRTELDLDATIVEEVAGKSDHVAIGGRRIHVAGFLDRFLFPGGRKEAVVSSLSGGERARLLVAKLMLSGANVLVLDEPSNDLDLPTLRALEEALVAFEGSAVVVSHDRWFLDRVATHVLHLDGEGGAYLHTGDVTSLIERVTAERSERLPRQATATAKTVKASPEKAQPTSGRSTPPKPAAKSGSKASKTKSEKRLAPWEEREFEELTEAIESLETRLAKLDAELADPAIYLDDGTQARGLEAQRREVQRELAPAMKRWEALAERV